MRIPENSRIPKQFEGKTYSLVGEDGTSEEFFRIIARAVDALFVNAPNITEIRLNPNQNNIRNINQLSRFLCNSNRLNEWLSHASQLGKDLGRFTANVDQHRRHLSLSARMDRTLNMSERRYHLSMLEIEIRNRLSTLPFRQSVVRLAFLPHCLKDPEAACRSAIRGADYVCKGCSARCVVNAVSKALRRHGVAPYIWMTADIPSLVRRLRKEGRSIGVLGIACIPELIHGMRAISRLGVPTVGIPLDANRCARWWGHIYPNTVNLSQLERLLGQETMLKKRSPPADR